MVRPCFVSGATFNGDYLQTLDLRNCDFIQACLCKNNIFVQIIETGHIFLTLPIGGHSRNILRIGGFCVNLQSV